MLPEAGQRFGPYEILGKVGGGGMGVVFRAWDERLHRTVAVKLLRDEFQSPGMRQRFLLEARAASALSHPNICTIFDIGEQDGELYLVMELLEGKTLKERIGQSACTPEELVRFSGEVADALAAAHAKGIVHRDVKPANIFLQSKPGGESQVKVLDFGLAKISMAQRSGRDSRALELTLAGSTVGTQAYMSPEQARGESLDLRSDLFSLGIAMYEMATRRTPFRGATTALAFHALLTEAPEPIRVWNPGVPRELERIIARLLMKERAERYQTAHEVVEALRRLAARGDGEWLRRLPRANVPLVPARDPVRRRGWRSREGSGSSSGEAAPVKESGRVAQQETGESGRDQSVLRPKRLPVPESGPRNPRVEAGTAPGEAGPKTDPGARRASEAGGEVAPEEVVGVAEEKIVEASATHAVEEPGTGFGGLDAERADAAKEEGERVAAGAVEVETRPEVQAASGVPSGEPISNAEAVAAPETPVRARVEPWLADPAGPPRRRQSGPRAAAAAVQEEEAAGRKSRTTTLRTWLPVAAALTLLLLGGGACLLRSGSLGQVVLGPKDTVLLAPVLNRTGDPTLDLVVEEGLEIELEQRSALPWLGVWAMRAGMHRAAREQHVGLGSISPRAAAQRLGARAYVYGELTKEGDGYRVRVDVLDAASNDRLGSVSEAAGSRQELPEAITRLSLALRQELGEPGERLQASTPLALQATANLDALGWFARGEAAAADGEEQAAAGFYQRALAAAPDFVLAEMRLAWIYDEEGAELAAAQMAGRAVAAANRTGDRVLPLARVTAEMLGEEDGGRGTTTARELVHARPRDAEALVLMARVMRSQGHMTEALLSAQAASRLNPYEAAAYNEAAYALVGLDRYKEAERVKERAEGLGVTCACAAPLVRFLMGGPPGEGERRELRATAEAAVALDDAGRFAQGQALWEAGADDAKGDAATVSAAAGMLAQAALDRALAGRCAEAARLVQRAELLAYGRAAAFRMALAEELCSTGAKAPGTGPQARLLGEAHHGSLTQTQRLPLLEAVAAIEARAPTAALATMSRIPAERDAMPLMLYLRGMAREQAAEDGGAEEDLREAAQRRGYALLTGVAVASLAEERLAKVSALAGDKRGAEGADERFHQLWKDADGGIAATKLLPVVARAKR